MEQTDHHVNGSPREDERSAGAHNNDPLADLYRYLNEVQALIGYYLSVRRDQLTAAFRSTALTLAIASFLCLTGLCLLLAAAFTAMRGVAGGVAAALEGNLWLGELIAGGGLVLLAILGALLFRSLLKRRWFVDRRKEHGQRLAGLNGHLPSASQGQAARRSSKKDLSKSQQVQEKGSEVNRAQH